MDSETKLYLSIKGSYEHTILTPIDGLKLLLRIDINYPPKKSSIPYEIVTVKSSKRLYYSYILIDNFYSYTLARIKHWCNRHANKYYPQCRDLNQMELMYYNR